MRTNLFNEYHIKHFKVREKITISTKTFKILHKTITATLYTLFFSFAHL